jgi:hypothetical protein
MYSTFSTFCNRLDSRLAYSRATRMRYVCVCLWSRLDEGCMAALRLAMAMALSRPSPVDFHHPSTRILAFTYSEVVYSALPRRFNIFDAVDAGKSELVRVSRGGGLSCMPFLVDWILD